MRKPIPFYVDDLVDEAVSILNDVKTDSTVAFAFLTDAHNCMDLIERDLYAVSKINERYPLQFHCLGGDYLCNNVNTTKEMAMNQHRELRAALDELGQNPPTMVAKGNHDDNPFAPISECISRDQLFDILVNPSRFVVDPEQPKAMYGYYDIPNEKIRAIWLDSVDRDYETDENGIVTNRSNAGFGNRQINWFANVALKLPASDWSVVLFTHILPVPSRVMYGRMFGGDAIMDILGAFKRGEAYSARQSKNGRSFSVECDFTEQGAGDVIAFICGHKHADRTTVLEGIRTICCNSAASDNFSMPEPGDPTVHRKTRGSGEESAFTIFAVHREKRKITVLRCGAGPNYTVDY